MTRGDRKTAGITRQRAYVRGQRAETAAVLFLTIKGYAVVARRFKTHTGEIDIVARRGQQLVFVEVKQRPSLELAQAAVTDATRRRVRRAAQDWLAHHPQHQNRPQRFDLIFILPWRLPVHLPGGL